MKDWKAVDGWRRRFLGIIIDGVNGLRVESAEESFGLGSGGESVKDFAVYSSRTK